MRHPLTDEQRVAVEHFRSAENLKIEAFAGSGKTSTLIALAEATPAKSGHYFAFNKAIADDARSRFPKSVSTSTVHSVAFQYVSKAYSYSPQKLNQSPTVNQIAHLLQTMPKSFYRLFDRLDVNGREYASVFHQACKNFLASADPEPAAKHFQKIGKLQAATDAEMMQFAEHYLPNVQVMWNEMLNEASPYPLGHDGYLKLWALSQPRLAKDFILLDEAQDTSDVVLDVLANQACQIVYVGDEHQQIYEWRGAVNAMKKTSTMRASGLTLSFRFGQKIADAAGAVLAKLDCKTAIKGNSAISSVLGEHEPQTILCRSNVQVIETVVDQLSKSRRCYVVGGIRELVALLQEVASLKRGIPSRHQEFFGFEDWHDVLSYCEDSPANPLKVLVKLVTRFGEQQLIEILRKTSADDFDAQVVVSTTHKAKGREWNRVALHEGFDSPYLQAETEPVSEAEMRLFYVAITRAKTHLYVPPDAVKHYGIISE